MTSLKVIKFLILPLSEKRLLYEAWFFQLEAGFLLKIVPFRNIPRLFSNPEYSGKGEDKIQDQKNIYQDGSPSSAQGEGPVTVISTALLSSIRSALLITSPYSLWHNRCLVQSLAGRRMLSRRGIVSRLSMGVIKTGAEKTAAHAWLRTGDFYIVNKGGDYLEMYAF